MSEHDYLIPDFVSEALEILEGYDEDLVRLEADSTNQELINSLFRRVHNIKGMCGFLHLVNLERLSHSGEDLLDQFRKSSGSAISSAHVDLLLRLGDSMRLVLNAIQATGQEGTHNFEGLLAAIQNPVVGNQAWADSQTTSADEPPEPQINDTSLRVDIALLDHLMNLAGELVLSRNQLVQTTKDHRDNNLRAIIHKLNSVTSELQECVMKTRVQPIASLWDKLPRVVRDASHDTNKKINLTTSGEETELDKAILEAIKDPIVHLIRNSIDHGIESPERRAALGKSLQGNLSLRAFPEGGNVIIELKDDGAGLNTEKIKNKAISQGLIYQKQAASMTEQQLQKLIFSPGFSTAEKVTRVSGRGVGMDVVKANIEAIGGHVQINSELNRGTVTRLKIPMTLSIIPTLLVSSSGETFAIPEASVTELVRIEESRADKRLITIGTTAFLRLREKLLPVVYLDQYLNINQRDINNKSDSTAIILCVDGCLFALLVDAVHDIQEIVVKPLDPSLLSLDLYSGATILGDGRIVLIVDPSGILRHLEFDRSDDLRDVSLFHNETKDSESSGDEFSFLIVQTSDCPYTAIPLNRVQRIERVSVTDISQIANSLTIQYRGKVLPIIDLSNASSQPDPSQSAQIVVASDIKLGEIGIRVDRVLDISASVKIDTGSNSYSQRNNLEIIDNKTTLILDMDKLFARALVTHREPIAHLVVTSESDSL